MAQPMPLRELYTAVQALTRRSRFSDKVSEMEQAFRERSRNDSCDDRAPRREGIAVANEQRFLSVLGQPGAGKSTFLKRVGLEAVMRGESTSFRIPVAYHHACLPVFLELKALDPAKGLLPAICAELGIAGFPPSFVTTALESGKLLVLLDGLDEVRADRQDAVIRVVRDFVDEYDKNRYILSCRTAFYRAWVTRFTDVVLADFDARQIESFIRNWFRSELDQRNGTAEAFLRRLRAPEHVATLELAATPLLLTFLCLVFDTTQRLPVNRASLYDQALDILLQRWAAEKRVDRQIYEGFTPELELVLLGELAHSAFERDQIFFSKKQLADRVRAFLEQQLNAPRTLDAERVLEAIEVHQGLLIERTHDVYSFSHLTLQEYLVARHISEEGLLESTVKEHLFDRRWKEVFLLLANMAHSQTLLKAMVKHLEIYAHGDQWVVEWLRTAQRLAVSDQQHDQCLLHRSRNSFFALSLTLALALEHSLAEIVALARDCAFALSNHQALGRERAPDLSAAIRTARTLDRAHDLGRDRNLALILVNSLIAEWQTAKSTRHPIQPSATSTDSSMPLEFAERRIATTLLTLGFHLPESRDSVVRLAQVFTTTQLIVDCKAGSLRLKGREWEKLCANLLTAPELLS